MLQEALYCNRLLGTSFSAFPELYSHSINRHLESFVHSAFLFESPYCMDRHHPCGRHHYGISMLLFGERSPAFHISTVSKALYHFNHIVINFIVVQSDWLIELSR